jgi:thiamine-monophosphate kinase
MSSEFTRIAALQSLFGSPPPGVVIGIGDDAAVLVPPSSPLIWTVDASVEGTHFRRDLLTLEDIGYRSTMAAASDLAAMAGEPLGILAAIVLPSGIDDEELFAIAEGQKQAAMALGTNVIGGNLARGGELSITTSVLGVAVRPLSRAGARAGDGVWIAGPVGLAAAGHALLNDARLASSASDLLAADAATMAFRRPEARIREGLAASVDGAAAIDISDGLAQDLGHLAVASGVRIVLFAEAVVGDELRSLSVRLGRDPLDWALYGGEDYALVVVGPDPFVEGFSKIGVVELGSPFVGLRRADGEVVRVDRRGYDHFSPEARRH